MATVTGTDKHLVISGEQIEEVVGKVPTIETDVKSNKQSISALQTTSAQHTEDIEKNTADIELKANADEVYSKDETDSAITAKVAEIVAGAPEEFDTLKEMSDWLTEHSDSAATMNTAIQANTKAIAENTADIEENTADIEQNKSDILSVKNDIARVETSLQSQLDSIVLESSESGNVTAEVVQARTDVNGLNHTTLKERIDTIDEAVVKNKISIPISIEIGGFDDNGYKYDNNTRARTCGYLPANPLTDFKFPLGTKHRILYYTVNGVTLMMTDWSESTIENIVFPDADSNIKIRLLIAYVDNRVITSENIPVVYMEYNFDFSINKIPYIDGYAITASESVQKYSGFRLSAMIPVESGKSYKASKFRNTQTFDKNGQAVRLLETADIADDTITINEGESYVCFCWRVTDTDEMYFAEKEKFIEGKTIDDFVNYPLFGKKLSLLGDSISAYTGTVPVGNDIYYTGANSGVTSPNQMWWNVFCRKTGMTPLVINAWSGSAITQLTDSAHSTKIPMSDVSRSQALHTETETPDVILIAGGVNDFSYAQSQQHNPNDWNGKTAPVNGNSFTETYACMIKNIQSAYPNAIVICLSTWFTMRGTDNGYTRVNDTGYTQADYNAEIRKVAEIMHVPFIDVSQCGFNRNNFYPNYAIDSESIPTHPNAEGHKIMGTYLADTVPQIINAFVNK